jgi:hypothetical protein
MLNSEDVKKNLVLHLYHCLLILDNIEYRLLCLKGLFVLNCAFISLNICLPMSNLCTYSPKRVKYFLKVNKASMHVYCSLFILKVFIN